MQNKLEANFLYVSYKSVIGKVIIGKRQRNLKIDIWNKYKNVQHFGNNVIKSSAIVSVSIINYNKYNMTIYE